MDSLRPEPLPEKIAMLYHEKDSLDSIAWANRDVLQTIFLTVPE